MHLNKIAGLHCTMKHLKEFNATRNGIRHAGLLIVATDTANMTDVQNSDL